VLSPAFLPAAFKRLARQDCPLETKCLQCGARVALCLGPSVACADWQTIRTTRTSPRILVERSAPGWPAVACCQYYPIRSPRSCLPLCCAPPPRFPSTSPPPRCSRSPGRLGAVTVLQPSFREMRCVVLPRRACVLPVRFDVDVPVYGLCAPPFPMRRAHVFQRAVAARISDILSLQLWINPSLVRPSANLS
jgi:hypothetical protein